MKSYTDVSRILEYLSEGPRTAISNSLTKPARSLLMDKVSTNMYPIGSMLNRHFNNTSVCGWSYDTISDMESASSFTRFL